MRRTTALALLAVAVTGCGGSDKTDNSSKYEGEKADVAAVVDDLTDAARDKDGQRICTQLFTRNLAVSVRRASRQPCGDAVTKNIGAKDADFKVTGINLVRNQATIGVQDQKKRRSLLQLQKAGGSWRIAAIRNR
jgi:hypothetical protein